MFHTLFPLLFVSKCPSWFFVDSRIEDYFKLVPLYITFIFQIPTAFVNKEPSRNLKKKISLYTALTISLFPIRY